MGFEFSTQTPTFTAAKTTSLNYNSGGGQFEPDKGGHFAPDSGGHFQPERGGQFDRIFHVDTSYIKKEYLDVLKLELRKI